MYHSFYLEQEGKLNIRKKTMVYVENGYNTLRKEQEKLAEQNRFNQNVIVPYASLLESYKVWQSNKNPALSLCLVYAAYDPL